MKNIIIRTDCPICEGWNGGPKCWHCDGIGYKEVVVKIENDNDALLRRIKDRIVNNIGIQEYADGREAELINIDIVMDIIKNDLENYIIVHKSNINKL